MQIGAGSIKTGNPVLDAVLNMGVYGLIAGAAYLLAKFLYEGRETDRAKAAADLAEAHGKRESDWEMLRDSWEKERQELYAFRELSRGEWDKERSELIRQRDFAQAEAADSRRTANEALAGVRAFLENGQKETLATLRESNSALKEAAMKERALEERNKAQERDLEMLRGMVLQMRSPRELPGATDGGPA